MINIIKFILNKLINFIYPNKCAICDNIIEDKDTLCSNCWGKIHFISKPFCYKCSKPFENEIDKNDICIKCIKEPPLYIQARSAVIYNNNISKLLFNFKFYGKTFLKKFMAKTMINASRDIIDKIDILIPVPLHKKRLIHRKYNQSLLLCYEIAKQTKKNVIYNFLKKIKNTPSQTTLKYKERKKNLKNKFIINPKYLKNIEIYKNYNFAIIDDVITTGSTVNECIKILNKYDIKNVYVITFAKTIF